MPTKQPDEMRSPCGPEDELKLAPTNLDGSKDVVLQKAMSMPGATSYTAVDSIETARHMLQARSSGDSTGSLVGFVTPQGHYLIEFDAAAVAGLFPDSVKTAPPGHDGPSPKGGLLGTQGWSNGVDNRTIGTAPIEQGRVIASGWGTCSGALIGRRIVRTAAHCVVANSSSGGAAVGSVTFESARSGTSVWATDTTSSFFYGGAYIGSGCGTSSGGVLFAGYLANTNACTWADWAMLILDTNWYSEASSISWYGYSGLTTANLGLDLASGGYPSCDDVLTNSGVQEGTMIEDPAGCLSSPNRWWKDSTTAVCEVGSWDGSQSKFFTGCDVSPSNSGGPVLQRGAQMLIGHALTQGCGATDCGSANNYPNRYLGHDDWLFNYQNQLRNTYP